MSKVLWLLLWTFAACTPPRVKAVIVRHVSSSWFFGETYRVRLPSGRILPMHGFPEGYEPGDTVEVVAP